MRYGNEIKVGAALLLTAAALFFGVRFLDGLPLFDSGYVLYTQLDTTGGLGTGGSVRLRGIRIGQVERVELFADGVRVTMKIQDEVPLPQGSVAVISGVSALGGVGLSIRPGDGPPLEAGATIPGVRSADPFALLDEASPLLGRADTALLGATATFASADRILAGAEPDLRATLAQLRAATTGLNGLLNAERGRLQTTLAGLERTAQNADRLTGTLDRFTAENADTLAATVQRLNTTLAQIDRNLSGLESLTTRLDTTLAALNRGEGTLGRLMTDPALYDNANAAAVNLNRILLDLENNPGRYLKEMRLVDLF